MYWRRGWSVFLTPRFIGSNLLEGLRRFFLAFAANRFIFRRGRMRGLAHWLMMWGCVLAAAMTFPLVWGWIHFETVAGRLDLYRTYVFGFPVNTFRVDPAPREWFHTPTYLKPLLQQNGQPPCELNRFDIKNRAPLPDVLHAGAAPGRAPGTTGSERRLRAVGTETRIAPAATQS